MMLRSSRTRDGGTQRLQVSLNRCIFLDTILIVTVALSISRFRIKKKHKALNLERTVSELEGRADVLEREAVELRRENGWLKEMLVLKGRTVRAAREAAASLGGNAGEDGEEDEDDNDDNDVDKEGGGGQEAENSDVMYVSDYFHAAKQKPMPRYCSYLCIVYHCMTRMCLYLLQFHNRNNTDNNSARLL